MMRHKKHLLFKSSLISLALVTGLLSSQVYSQDLSNGANNFYRSEITDRNPVEFNNLYQMKVAGTLILPPDFDESKQYSAIIVGHPMGAVKEQSATLYAEKLAEQGFVTLAIDLSFWGESEGNPRNAVLPDMYTEDFNAATDFLGSQSFIDQHNIGVLGICGSGSFAISAAKIDSRLKAIATVSMYDMGSANRDALNKSLSIEERKKIIDAASKQRDVEYNGGETQYTSGTLQVLTDGATPIEREFFDFYRTERGEFTPESSSPQLTTHPTVTSNVKFMNFYPFNDIETISPRPLLFITGDNAHSIEFSQDAYQKSAEPKELYIVPNAGHVDLYDRVDLIPFDKLTDFFKTNLN